MPFVVSTKWLEIETLQWISISLETHIIYIINTLSVEEY